MLEQEQETRQEAVQGVRSVYKNGHSASSSPSDVVFIDCHEDGATGKDVVLWDDILLVFKDALYVRNGSRAITFLKGTDFRTYVFFTLFPLSF